jgi:ubiquinone biosynthesis accessory factor UbiJ
LDALQDSLLAAAEIGGNHLLTYDEEALAGCRDLQGHCIEIHITDIDFRVYCHPGDWGVRLSRNPPARDVDASIRGRLMALASLAAEDDKLSTSMQQRVSFHGGVQLAQKLQRILGGLDVDWEEMLSRQVGDVLAFQIHDGLRRAGNRVRRTVDSLLQTSSEYLREEARLSPTTVEFDDFQAGVTRLRNDVDRAEARLERLAGKLRSR